jgi:hypothetical protein
MSSPQEKQSRKELFATIAMESNKALNIYQPITAQLLKALHELSRHRIITPDDLEEYKGIDMEIVTYE